MFTYYLLFNNLEREFGFSFMEDLGTIKEDNRSTASKVHGGS